MEKLLVDYQGGMKFRAQVRGHQIISDLPDEKGGSDSGPTPPELLISSLGTCIGVYAATFAERHNISLEGMQVELEWERSEEPTRIGRIHAELSIPGGVPERYRDGLMRSVNSCMVHNTLCHTPHIELRLAE